MILILTLGLSTTCLNFDGSEFYNFLNYDLKLNVCRWKEVFWGHIRWQRNPENIDGGRYNCFIDTSASQGYSITRWLILFMWCQTFNSSQSIKIYYKDDSIKIYYRDDWFFFFQFMWKYFCCAPCKICIAYD